MDDEMNALIRNGKWEIVILLKDKKPVGCRWVFTVKYNSDGSHAPLPSLYGKWLGWPK